MVVIMLTTTAGLLLSGTGIVIADSLLFHEYLERDLSTLARIISDNSTAALEFDEPHAAGETLSALRERPHIVTACVYRKNGTVLATYHRAGSETGCSTAAARYEVVSTREAMTISQPILLDGDRVGTLVMRYDLGEVAERLQLYGTTVLGVLLISSLAAFLLSSRLRAIIATPISKLARAATSVTATKDYSIRAERYSRDELGLLVDAFNEMLSGIQSRDSDLTKALVEREEALAEARSTRDFLRTTLASIGDAVISADCDGLIIFANPVALALLQRTEAETTGKPADDLFRIVSENSHNPIERPVEKVLRQGSPVVMTDRTLLIGGDGTEIPIEYSAAPILAEDGKMAGVVLISRDVTERHKAEQERQRHSQEMLATEERLRETAKLESLGVLAGGIAHDFNNLLVGVMGNASLALDMVPQSSPAFHVIENVISASEKAAQLTHQMLAYSGKGRFIIECVDLSKEVEGILPLISRPIPKTVSVQQSLEENLPAIEADKSQLQQILMNLVINGAEACGAQPGAVLIATRRCELDNNAVPASFGLAPSKAGTFVCLEVRDTGSGMSDDVKAKIFDPFFTTKFTGRGLGLSAVLGIIRSHKGAVQVESAPGAGTTFRVFFPAVAGKADTEHPEARDNAAALRGQRYRSGGRRRGSGAQDGQIRVGTRRVQRVAGRGRRSGRDEVPAVPRPAVHGDSGSNDAGDGWRIRATANETDRSASEGAAFERIRRNGTRGTIQGKRTGRLFAKAVHRAENWSAR